MTKLARYSLQLCLLLVFWPPVVCLAQSTRGAGKIVFVGVGGIFVMNSDGTGRTLLPWTRYDYYPTWSPDGRRIAHYRVTNGPSSILIMNADGSNQMEVVHDFTPPTNNIIDSPPSWSPDGRQLTFSYGSDIYAVGIDGSHIRVLRKGNSPAWSPDGTSIAFGSDDGSIFTMDVSGGSVTRLTNGASCSDRGSFPSWSPDGTQIAYSDDCGLFDPGIVIISRKGGLVRRLRLGVFADYVSKASWSLDGNQIVFDTTYYGDDGPVVQIRRINSDGSGLRTLVETGNNSPDWQRAIPPPAAMDFDGDGRADISVFRPSDQVWYLNRTTAGFAATRFGLSSDSVTPADFDGDGKTDIAVFRDSTWYWISSSNDQFNAFQFGQTGDIPVPADYTGDGRAELAVYRNGQWWSLDLSNGQVSVLTFGLPTDKPVVADYDGDGKSDQAIYRNGEWHLNLSTTGYRVVSFGLSTDQPLTGDFDGDGKADPSIYRDGAWYVLQSSEGVKQFQFGLGSDIPVPADYDGDGKTDLAIYRNGQWWIRQSSSGGVTLANFGLPNDRPIPSAYMR